MKELVETTARQAGELLMTYFRKPDLQVTIKKDDSPVTEADLAANDLIQKALQPLGYPIVSEEQIPEVVEGDEYFIVDPLDGTKHFKEGETSFATLIGFVSQGEPVLGVAYFPALNLFYTAEKGKGAFLNGTKIFNTPKSGPITAYSSGFHRRPQAQVMMEYMNIDKVLEEGSVLKLARIAEGVADFYPRFGPTSEWDTAACQVILEEAGCELWDWGTLKPLKYGKKNFANNGFIAFRKDLETKVIEVYRNIPARKES